VTACNDITHIISGTEYKFSDKAISEVKIANSDSDNLSGEGTLLGDFWNEEVHFDNEGLDLCSGRLILLRDKIISALTVDEGAPDGGIARKFLGQAHHTLQDFYAHSNWVELEKSGYRKGPNQDLGVRNLPKPENFDFCPEDPDTLNPDINATTTGYFNLPSPWLIPIPGIVIGSGLALSFACFDYPSGKCRHGVDGFCDGINKDRPETIGHGRAQALARQSSTNYIRLILDDPRIADNVEAVEAFMGIQGTLAFVIDDTVSYRFYFSSSYFNTPDMH
jgi:von Willebrand factor A domain-containing protein 7